MNQQSLQRLTLLSLLVPFDRQVMPATFDSTCVLLDITIC